MKLSLQMSITLHRLFNNIADKLFSFFVPVLIYNATQNLFLALLFLLFEQVIRATLILLTKKICAKNPVLLISLRLITIVILQVLFVVNINFSWWTILIMATLVAINTAFYWPELNTIFAVTNKRTNTAKAVSAFENAGNLGKMIAPLIGGVLIFNNYLWVNILICFVFYSVSIVFLLINVKEINGRVKEVANTKNTLEDNIKNNRSNLLWFYALVGLRDFAIDQTLPLILAVKNIDVNIIGLSYTMLELGIIVSNIITSFISTEKHWYVISLVCSALLGTLLMVVPFFINDVFVVVYTVVIGLLNPFCVNVMFSKLVGVPDARLINDVCNREAVIIGAKILPATIAVATCILPIGVIIGGVAYYLYSIPYTYEYKKDKLKEDGLTLEELKILAKNKDEAKMLDELIEKQNKQTTKKSNKKTNPSQTKSENENNKNN